MEETSIPSGPALDATLAGPDIIALRAKQNLGLAVVAGIIGAILGGGAWAAFVLATDRAGVVLSIIVGFIVGQGVKKLGKGYDMIFGFVGAICSLLGGLGGVYFAELYAASDELETSISELIENVGVQESIVLVLQSVGISWIFIACSVWIGFKLSFVPESPYAVKQGKKFI